MVQTAVVYGANGSDYASALVLALCALFFLQAGFGAMTECAALYRRSDSEEEDGDSMLAVPLANVMNPLANASPPCASTLNC